MKILAAGDAAFIIEFGQIIDRDLFAKVAATNRQLHQLHAHGLLDGLIETVPTFRSLAVIYDPLITSQRSIVDALATHPQPTDSEDTVPVREWLLPVCYGEQFGPDLDHVARLTGLTTSEVIQLHLSPSYTVYMLGFLPGYAFMGDLPEALRLPRRTEPRTRVPKGSVSIAKQLTGVYPWECPGGWHLLGYCPVPLFNASRQPPALLRVDDVVRFNAVSPAELATLQQDIDAQRLDPDSFRLP